MSRTQFSLKTLLWLTVVAAAFFADAAVERRARVEEREKAEAKLIEFLERSINHTDR